MTIANLAVRSAERIFTEAATLSTTETAAYCAELSTILTELSTTCERLAGHIPAEPISRGMYDALLKQIDAIVAGIGNQEISSRDPVVPARLRDHARLVTAFSRQLGLVPPPEPE